MAYGRRENDESRDPMSKESTTWKLACDTCGSTGEVRAWVDYDRAGVTGSDWKGFRGQLPEDTFMPEKIRVFCLKCDVKREVTVSEVAR
jgi:hypothetical protein